MIQANTFKYEGDLVLEAGGILSDFELSYTTYGTMNEKKDNVIWVCHAFTGSSDFTDWWPGFFGEDKLYDPRKHFVICANVIGGCYGSTGPLSTNPATGEPYYHSFPHITNKDMIETFEILKDSLGIGKIHTVIGVSLGGQHALKWAVEYPDNFERLIAVGCNAQHSAWGIAFNESQRMAIEQDSSWKLSTDTAGLKGMKTARAIALISYRNFDMYVRTQTEETDEKTDHFKASSYQQYQGNKLVDRFNAYSYWVLSKCMDSHNVGRGQGGVEKALAKVTAKSLLIGSESDILFPVVEQDLCADLIPDATMALIDSAYGHDGFLLEFDRMAECIQSFYDSEMDE